MAASIGLGTLFNVVGVASGVHIRMKHGQVATFVAFLAAGNHSVSLNESIDGSSEQALAVIDTIYKAPGIGGTWTKVTQTAAATYAVTDATNDCIAISVNANELSPGFNCLEFNNTASIGSVYITGLYSPAAPERLASLIS